MNGSGVAAQMGLHPKPVGTPEELRAQMVGLKHVGSCAPPSKGVRGCSRYDTCLFRLTRYGGFRRPETGVPAGRKPEAYGPHNIRFFHQPDEGESRRDFMDCYTFMFQMAERMFAGEEQRRRGKPGEIIRIIAQEGQPIRRMLRVNLNEGIPGQPHKWGKKTETIDVPKFPRPGEAAGSEFFLDMERDEVERLRSDPELSEGLPAAPEDASGPVLEELDEEFKDEGAGGEVPTGSGPAPRRKTDS